LTPVAPCGSSPQFGKESGWPFVSVAYHATASWPAEPACAQRNSAVLAGEVLTRTGVVQLSPWSVEDV
jgi:hypothetical protein